MMSLVRSVYKFIVAVFLTCTMTVDAVDFPVDIVYTWVDGSDPAWQEVFHKYREEEESNLPIDSCSTNRFRNRNELKYSLRSVYKFARFFNRIYIVTFNQTPDWLAPHPKIVIIDHKEIFKKTEDLPTFNSHAIEANLHRIPNLSEHYIYLNDDILFTQKVIEEDFFSSEGFIKLILQKGSTPRGKLKRGDIGWTAGQKNVSRLLEKLFGRKYRRIVAHAPYPMKKSVVERLETRFPWVFTSVSSHRFRSKDDYAMTNGIIPYYAEIINETKKSSLRWKVLGIKSELAGILSDAMHEIKNKDFHSICLQDASEQLDDEEEECLQAFLNELYPEPAPWELDTPVFEFSPKFFELIRVLICQ